jgi:hypothetical protein
MISLMRAAAILALAETRAALVRARTRASEETE